MLAFAAIPAGSLVGAALLAFTGHLGPLVLISGVLQLAIGLIALRTALHAPSAHGLGQPPANVVSEGVS
jgi:hypothetical protein